MEHYCKVGAVAVEHTAALWAAGTAVGTVPGNVVVVRML